MDYDSLRHEFPSLVMAQLTAWGMDGPGSALAGYDIGAFWTSTGMASLVHDEGNYSVYPLAAGDCVTGGALLSALNIALTERARSGQGQHVHTSLLHTGIFCLSHTLATTAAQSTPSYAKNTRRTPCHTSYRTRDARRIVLLGGAVPDQHWLRTLSAGIGSTQLRALAKTLEGKQADQLVDHDAWLAALDTCFAQHDLEPLCELLDNLRVPHCIQPSVPEMANPAADVRGAAVGDDLAAGGARCFADGRRLGIVDIPRIARNPLNLSCSSQTAHGGKWTYLKVGRTPFPPFLPPVDTHICAHSVRV